MDFSKFASLRPKECVLAGESGTHSVCVCTIHQNVKLMIHDAKLSQLTKEEEVQESVGLKHISCYKDCIAEILCSYASCECFLGKCQHCESLDHFKEKLLTLLNNAMIDEIQYKQWISTDRTNLETLTKPTDEFVDFFCGKLKLLRRHDFIAKQQSTYCAERKESLIRGEISVTGDFSENYSFVLQDAAQGFHWNNAQATLHPCCVLHRKWRNQTSQLCCDFRLLSS